MFAYTHYTMDTYLGNISMNTNTRACPNISTYIHTHGRTYTRTHIHKDAHTQGCTHVRTRTHTHTHTHTHLPNKSDLSLKISRLKLLDLVARHCKYFYKDKTKYRISSINTASSISTAVWYYSNTNNIEFNVYFNSNAPSNNTT